MSLIKDLYEVHRQVSKLEDRSLTNPQMCDLSRLDLTTLKKIKFPGIKYAELKIHDNKLTTLEGCSDAFHIDASFNELTSLKGCPKSLHGINISENKGLQSLKGLPAHIDGELLAQRCSLTTLVGSPKSVAGGFSVYGNKLNSLAGAPKTVGIDYSGDFDVSGNPLKSLYDSPDEVQGSVYCTETNITSLQGIGRDYLKIVHGDIVVNASKIKSHVLGLLFIKGLTGLRYNTSEKNPGLDLVNEWLHKERVDGGTNRKDMLIDLQHALIEEGFDDLAQL